jgi:hypothetical protein
LYNFWPECGARIGLMAEKRELKALSSLLKLPENQILG